MQQLQNAIGRIALMVGGLSAKLEREEGQALVEYALIIALVAIACTGVLVALNGAIQAEFTKITGSL